MEKTRSKKYLGVFGAWALSFGCSVGWGSFVMPGTTFLPIAGPVGTAIGLGIGGLVMLVLALNFHYLMNRYPDCGGIYTYTKKAFGYDHGFLSAWFLILTYVAIIWANATALPLIARTVLGDTFRFGHLYQIAGYDIYLGEILLSSAALIIAAAVCFFRRLSALTQILLAGVLFIGVIICFVAAGSSSGCTGAAEPAFAPDKSVSGGIFTIFALAPWAFVGFESITHSAEESKFNLKKSFRIMLVALITAAIAYILLSLLAVRALPEGCSSWTEYIENLDKYSGKASLPTFFAAHTAMGNTGTVILGIAALGAIFTGLIGNYIALSRLLCSLSDDGLFPKWIGKKNTRFVPKNAMLSILGISLILPFFGRTAISWIVDVTTVGATIAYALASASAFKTARQNKDVKNTVIGLSGMVISVLFALEFLIPNILSISTLSMESYLILTIWSILGFLYFRVFLHRDKERKMGHSILAWIVLLGLIIFTSTIWMRQTTDKTIYQSETEIRSHYESQSDTADNDVIKEEMENVDDSLETTSSVQIALICFSLIILLRIYGILQKREKQMEVEKALAEESSRAKTSFLSNMSHEIRTPMNAIIGLDNIALRDPDLPPKTREHLEKIGASADHLLELINDILDMSRIESGRMILKNEEFSFREFLDQINIIINGQCQDKGLVYDCHIVGDVNDYYIGDDMKLKQVMINILGNAVKFTEPNGSVTLTVEQIGQTDGICTLRFIMKDTGIGMDKEFIPKIFESFSQEDATTTNKYGGSGLGMAITKNFVEMMNGKILVESEKGKGSVFTVTVKLAGSDRKAKDEHSIVLPEGLCAVIVDDDEIACEQTQLVLRSLGIGADTFTDAKSALENIREACISGKPYDLLLTDYKMPEMDGLELTRHVHSFDNGHTAVIMLTGCSWDIPEAGAKTDGVDGILAKPLFSDVLHHEIYKILSDKNGTQQESTETAGAGSAEEILAGRRVLMAEDVEQNAEILADLLELEDIQSEHAWNGKQAVEMFSESEQGYYDAILMDVRMPEMDGLTATRKIRELDRPDAKTIPIIAMTANVFDEDIERTREAGMNAHLSKPVEPEKMYETMARLISGSDRTE